MNKFDQTYNLIMQSLQTEGVGDFLFSVKNLFTRQRKHNKQDRATNTYSYKSGRRVRESDIEHGTLRRKVAKIDGSFFCQNLEKLTNLQRGPNEVEGDFIVDNCPNFRFFCRSRKLRTFVHGRIIINNCPKIEKEYVQFFPYSNFTENFKLVYNPSTGRWDSEGSVTITNADLVNGQLPYNFGMINGNFDCTGCDNLTSDKGLPTSVAGTSIFDGCINMPGYTTYLSHKTTADSQARKREAQQEKKRRKEQSKNKIISDLVDDFDLHYNDKTNSYDCDNNIIILDKHLVDGKLPIQFGTVKGNFSFRSCSNLTSLQGTPRYVNGNFLCYNCINLDSLKYNPKRVGRTYCIRECKKIKSLDNMTKNIDGDFECINNGKPFTDKDIPGDVTIGGTTTFS